jgi:putative membrane protein
MPITISSRASRAVVTLGALLAVAVVLPAATRARAPLNDPTIVAIFDAANTWDIQTGKLAAARGARADVRQFGRMLVHDHTAVRQQGRDLAASLHVTPTPPSDFALAKDHAEAMTHLRSLHGAAFDTAFLRHEVAYHKAVLDAVTSTLLPATQNAQLKDLETKVAPAFQAHMMRAQQLLDAETGATK